MNIFLDANVFFAAVASEKGGSRGLFEIDQKKSGISLVANSYVLKEAKINIEKKLGTKKILDFYLFIARLDRVAETKVTEEQRNTFLPFINQKDIAVLVGAIEGKADILVTLDRADFRNETMQKRKWPFKILSPGECLREIRE